MLHPFHTRLCAKQHLESLWRQSNDICGAFCSSSDQLEPHPSFRASLLLVKISFCFLIFDNHSAGANALIRAGLQRTLGTWARHELTRHFLPAARKGDSRCQLQLHTVTLSRLCVAWLIDDHCGVNSGRRPHVLGPQPYFGPSRRSC